MKLTLSSCIFTLCWNVCLLRLRMPALRCQTARRCPAHGSIEYIEPWPFLTAGLLHCHSAESLQCRPRLQEASSRLGSVACCQPIVCSLHWPAQGPNCKLPPSARTAAPGDGSFTLKGYICGSSHKQNQQTFRAQLQGNAYICQLLLGCSCLLAKGFLSRRHMSVVC